MNKAILIVICDFLVSAMLTMMTGMVPGHSGGTGVGLDESTTKVLLSELNRRQQELEALRRQLREAWERTGITPEQEAELRRISAELARNLQRQQQLRARVTGQKTDNSPDSELRAQLEEAQSIQQELKQELENTRQLLKETGGKLRSHERDNAVLNRELGRTRDSLDAASKKLTLTQDELLRETRSHGQTREKLAASETERKSAEEQIDKRDKELDSARNELAQARKERDDIRKERDDINSAKAATQLELVRVQGDLRRLNSDLRGVQSRLRNAEAVNEKFTKEQEKLRLTYNANRTKLAVREQDYAEVKDRWLQEQQKVLVERLKRQDAETQRDMLKETVKELVAQNSDREKKLSESQQALAAAQGELKAKESTPRIEAVAVARENKVYDRYAEAILKVESLVSEKKFMGERTGKTESYYPVVDFGRNRIMIAGALNRFAGDWDVVMNFNQVTTVQMSFAIPYGQQEPQKLTRRMLVSGDQLHLAAFEYTGSTPAIRPLRVMDSRELQQQGVEELFIFKGGSFGVSGRLSGRVSLIPDAENPALFIRDVGRLGVKVEQGDFILSSQGEFVGIVSTGTRLNNADGMLVPLIKDVNELWERAVVVPLSKNPKEDFYSGYAGSMRELRRNKKIKGGYDRR